MSFFDKVLQSAIQSLPKMLNDARRMFLQLLAVARLSFLAVLAYFVVEYLWLPQWRSAKPVNVLSAIAGLVVVIFILLWRPRLYAVKLRGFRESDTWDQKLVEWERDRVLTLAKGVAGTAAAYLVALLPIIFQGNIRSSVSPFIIIDTIVGAIGAMVLAFDMVWNTRVFVNTPGGAG